MCLLEARSVSLAHHCDGCTYGLFDVVAIFAVAVGEGQEQGLRGRVVFDGKYVHFAGPSSFVMSQLHTSLGRSARSSGRW